MKTQNVIVSILAGIITGLLIGSIIGFKPIESDKVECVTETISASEIQQIGDIMADTWAESIEIIGRDSAGVLVLHVTTPDGEINIYGVE